MRRFGPVREVEIDSYSSRVSHWHWHTNDTRKSPILRRAMTWSSERPLSSMQNLECISLASAYFWYRKVDDTTTYELLIRWEARSIKSRNSRMSHWRWHLYSIRKPPIPTHRKTWSSERLQVSIRDFDSLSLTGVSIFTIHGSRCTTTWEGLIQWKIL